MQLLNNSDEGFSIPSRAVRGPFGSVQGGAVAAIMVEDLQRIADERHLGAIASVSAA